MLGRICLLVPGVGWGIWDGSSLRQHGRSAGGVHMILQSMLCEGWNGMASLPRFYEGSLGPQRRPHRRALCGKSECSAADGTPFSPPPLARKYTYTAQISRPTRVKRSERDRERKRGEFCFLPHFHLSSFSFSHSDGGKEGQGGRGIGGYHKVGVETGCVPSRRPQLRKE